MQSVGFRTGKSTHSSAIETWEVMFRRYTDVEATIAAIPRYWYNTPDPVQLFALPVPNYQSQTYLYAE